MPNFRRAGLVLLAVGVLMHAVLAGGAILSLRGGVREWLLLVAQRAEIGVGYLIVATGDRRLRKKSHPGAASLP